MSYRKIGGLHFVRVWRFGFTWYWSKAKPVMWNEWRDSDDQRN